MKGICMLLVLSDIIIPGEAYSDSVKKFLGEQMCNSDESNPYVVINMEKYRE